MCGVLCGDGVWVCGCGFFGCGGVFVVVVLGCLGVCGVVFAGVINI